MMRLLLKHKYIKRWRGPSGKYEYLYPEDLKKLKYSRKKADTPDQKTATFYDPHQDYAENRTHAKAFKDWFGDWENNPESASKVVHPRTGEPQEQYNMEPVKVYHGTPMGRFDAFTRQGDPDVLLYGPGWYFTEDKNVAATYVEKGRSPETMFTLSREVDYQDYELIRDILEEEIQYKPNLRRYLDLKDTQEDMAGLSHLMHYMLGSGSVAAERAQKKLQSAGRPLRLVEDDQSKVFEVFLNIRKPFDIDNDLINLEEIGPARENYEAAFGAGSAKGVQLSYNGALRWVNKVNLQGKKKPAMYQGKKVINEYLQSKGYDGITHVGGGMVNVGDPNHRVWIAFYPNQIKATENWGTFDPENPSLYKSKAKAIGSISWWKTGPHQKMGDGSWKPVSIQGLKDRIAALEKKKDKLISGVDIENKAQMAAVQKQYDAITALQIKAEKKIKEIEKVVIAGADKKAQALIDKLDTVTGTKKDETYTASMSSGNWIIPKDKVKKVFEKYGKTFILHNSLENDYSTDPPTVKLSKKGFTVTEVSSGASAGSGTTQKEAMEAFEEKLGNYIKTHADEHVSAEQVLDNIVKKFSASNTSGDPKPLPEPQKPGPPKTKMIGGLNHVLVSDPLDWYEYQVANLEEMEDLDEDAYKKLMTKINEKYDQYSKNPDHEPLYVPSMYLVTGTTAAGYYAWKNKKKAAETDAGGHPVTPSGYPIRGPANEEKQREEMTQYRRPQYAKDRYTYNGVDWTGYELDSLGTWVSSSIACCRRVREDLYQRDGYLKDEDREYDEIGWVTDVLEEKASHHPEVTTIYRGTRNPEWEDVQPGEVYPFGGSSFTHSKVKAEGSFGGSKYLLVYENPEGSTGIDINGMIEDNPVMARRHNVDCYYTEKEFFLREKTLLVTKVEEGLPGQKIIYVTSGGDRPPLLKALIIDPSWPKWRRLMATFDETLHEAHQAKKTVIKRKKGDA